MYNNINNNKNINKELIINKVIKNNTKEYYKTNKEKIKEILEYLIKNSSKIKEEEINQVKMAHKAYTNIDNRILKQIEKGMNKYNKPVNPNDYSMIGWYNHLQDELVDAMVYNEMKLMKLKETLKELKQAKELNNDPIVNFHIIRAISVLEDGLNN